MTEFRHRSLETGRPKARISGVGADLLAHFNLKSLRDSVPILPLTGAIVSRLAIYIVLIVAARSMEPDEFGAFAVLLAVINVISAVVSGGGDMWLNRFTWQVATFQRQAPRIWPVYMSLVLILGGAATLLMLVVEFGFGVLSSYRTSILLAVFASVTMGICESLFAILRASGAMRPFFLLRDILAPAAFVSGMILIQPSSARHALSLYATVWACTLVGLTAFFVWKAPTILPVVRVPKAGIRRVVAHTAGLIYGNLGARVSSYLDVFALTWLISLADVGAYRIAAQLVLGFTVIQHFVFLGLPWQMRQSGKRFLRGDALEMAQRRQRIFLSMAALAGIGLAAAAPPLFGALGSRFSGMITVFNLLLLIRFADLLWGPQHEILVSNGWSLADAHSNLGAIAVWAASFLSALSFMSPVGAAMVAASLGSLAAQSMRYVVTRKAGLVPVFGHPAGPALPLLAYFVAILGAVYLT